MQLDDAYNLLVRIEDGGDWPALTGTEIAAACCYLGLPLSNDLSAIRAEIHRQNRDIAKLLSGSSGLGESEAYRRSMFVRQVVELNRQSAG